MLTLHYVLQEYNDFLMPRQTQVLSRLMHALLSQIPLNHELQAEYQRKMRKKVKQMQRGSISQKMVSTSRSLFDMGVTLSEVESPTVMTKSRTQRTKSIVGPARISDHASVDMRKERSKTLLKFQMPNLYEML